MTPAPALELELRHRTADSGPDAERLELRLDPGEITLVDGDRGGAVVAALLDGRPERLRIAGRSLRRAGLARRVRAGLGIVAASAPLAPDVTVLDHLAAIRTVRRAHDLLAGAPLLAGRGADPAGVLSGGERRMLAWLRCVLTDPSVVLLDRAGTGLAPEVLSWCQDQITRWRNQQVALIVRPGRDEERAWVSQARGDRPVHGT